MTRKRQYTVREKVLKDLKINESVLYMSDFIKRVESGQTPSGLKKSIGLDYKTTQKFLALIPEIKEGWEKAPIPIGKENFSAQEQYRKRYPWDLLPDEEDIGLTWEQIKDYVDFTLEDMNRYDDLIELQKLVPEHLWSIQHLDSISLGVDYLSEYHKLNAKRIAYSGLKRERYYLKEFSEYNRFVYMHLEVFFRTIDKEIPESYFNLAMEFALESFNSGDRNLLLRAKLIVSYKLWEFEGNVIQTDGRYAEFKEALNSYTNDARVTNRVVEQIEKTIEEESGAE